jgi:hypothetical protein
VKVAHRVQYRRNQLALLFAPSQRQTNELLAKVRTVLTRLGKVEGNTSELRLANGSRVVALPGSEDATVRGFSAVDLLVFDEAAYVAENIYTAALPMLSARGQLLLMSTPGRSAGVPVGRVDQHRSGVAVGAGEGAGRGLGAVASGAAGGAAPVHVSAGGRGRVGLRVCGRRGRGFRPGEGQRDVRRHPGRPADP